MRLDFTSFQIAGPSTATDTIAETLFGQTVAGGATASGRGRCDTDQFAVAVAGGTSPPVICGTNDNQHMYIDTPTDCATLSFHLSATSGTTRQWNIKVTQYLCDYENLAPKGCTQYFFGNEGKGTVESFNYQAGTSVHLANQNQVVCVRREKNMCRICWAANEAGDFKVSMGMASSKGTNGPCEYASGEAAMGYDHVIIPQPVNTDSTAAAGALIQSKFCGSTLFLPTMAGSTGAPMVGMAAGVVSVCCKYPVFSIHVSM